MSLIFKCPTCGGEYDVSITSGSALTYLNNNQLVSLTNEDQDCKNCENEIGEEMKKAQEEARQRVRARKTNYD